MSGDTAVVKSSDSAYVFTRSGDSWSQQQKLTFEAPEFSSGDVSIDKDTIVLGNPCDSEYIDSELNYSGSVHVFTRSGTVWNLQRKITVPPYDFYGSNFFGSSVSLDDDTLVVGAPGDDNTGNSSTGGWSYVFTRSGTIWNLQHELTAFDGEPFNHFGHSVSISGDTAVISSKAGAYIYTGSGDQSETTCTACPAVYFLLLKRTLP
ncbi:MAG: hypothetical protein ACL93V_06800 [Candidatus Electrothrix sp. YB6]